MEGPCEFGLLVHGKSALLLYRFAPAIEWGHTPCYAGQVLDEEDLNLEEPCLRSHLFLRVMLVDADRNIIVGLRGVTLAPNVTLAVDRVIRQQIKGKIVISEFDAALNSAQRLLPVHARHGCQCNAGVGNNHCLKG